MKIPISISSARELLPTDPGDICDPSDLEILFRIGDERNILFQPIFSALQKRTPASGAGEPSFISFWDTNIGDILEYLSQQRSIRNSNENIVAQSLRPDYGLIFHGLCLFRGEEGPAE